MHGSERIGAKQENRMKKNFIFLRRSETEKLEAKTFFLA
jgi:hypothetical protein